MKTFLKAHKISAILMVVCAVICLYTGHKMIAKKKSAE